MAGHDVVSEAFLLEVGEEGASTSVAEQVTQVTSGTGLVVLVVVLQGEGQVQVVDLPEEEEYSQVQVAGVPT